MAGAGLWKVSNFGLIFYVGTYPSKVTHALIKLHIAAIVYYINTLDIQSSGRGRGGPNFQKVGDLL